MIHFCKMSAKALIVGAGLLMVLTGCNPGKQESGLSPIIYLSPTAQTRLAETLLNRVMEMQWMVQDRVQFGYGLPLLPVSGFQLSDSGFYRRVLSGDTMLESVRFVPDVWATPQATLDSVEYRWERINGDSVQIPIYRYRVLAKRLPMGPPPQLDGLAEFVFYQYLLAGDGFWHDYSYSLQAQFTEPGGNPPPLAGAIYHWQGTGLTWENDGVPSRWPIAGTAARQLDGGWNISFTLNGEDYLHANLDSTGIGTYQIGWDAFGQTYHFQVTTPRQGYPYSAAAVISEAVPERLARTRPSSGY